MSEDAARIREIGHRLLAVLEQSGVAEDSQTCAAALGLTLAAVCMGCNEDDARHAAFDTAVLTLRVMVEKAEKALIG